MIETVTDHAGEDLNRVVGVLHKQLERGYVDPSRVIELAGLITSERDKALRRVLDLADSWEGRAQGVAGWYGDHYRSLAAAIREAVEAS